MLSSSTLYAAIDLGSNSPHVGGARGGRQHSDPARIKRKVRRGRAGSEQSPVA
ncbi:hypothetical protein M8494_34830 [Serratia ureilytica]